LDFCHRKRLDFNLIGLSIWFSDLGFGLDILVGNKTPLSQKNRIELKKLFCGTQKAQNFRTLAKFSKFSASFRLQTPSKNSKFSQNF
jgi:hypothetical protein